MTSGSKVPGILLLMLNLGICYLAIINAKIKQQSIERCPEIDQFKENKPQKIHY